MSTINDLSVTATVSSADKLPMWSNANGVTRGLPISVLDSRYISVDGVAALAASPTVETFVSGTDFTPGVSVALTVANQYYSAQNIEVFFDASYQGPDQYSLIGLGLVFNSAIPVGVQNVYVRGGSVRQVGTPSQGSVTDSMLAAGSAVYNRVFSIIEITDPQYGAVGDGVHDDTQALVKALAKAATMGSAKITARPGKYKFTSLCTYTFPNAVSALKIVGSGSGVTEFTWTSGDGLRINYLGAFNTVSIEGVSVTTSTTGTGFGIFLNQTGTGITDPGNSGLNSFTDVMFHGADGIARVQYWGEALHVFGVSNINFFSCQWTGPLAFYSVNGIGVNIFGTSSLIPVVYNFFGCTFNLLDVGFLYGLAVQGVTFTGCNFTGNAIGIGCNNGVPDGSLVQLSAVNCQFNSITAINMPSQIQDVQIANCEFLIPQNGTGVNSVKTYNLSLCNNHFNPSAFSLTNTNGVVIDNTFTNTGALITGNMFWNLTSGVALTANTHAVSVQSNLYLLCTSNVNNFGTGNIIGGGTP